MEQRKRCSQTDPKLHQKDTRIGRKVSTERERYHTHQKFGVRLTDGDCCGLEGGQMTPF